jgi:hypothetical protein
MAGPVRPGRAPYAGVRGCNGLPTTLGSFVGGTPITESTNPNTRVESFRSPVRRSHSQEQSTTRDPTGGTQSFRVTHPFHPLYGREFVLVDRRQTWGEDRVYFIDETNTLRRLPAAWTSAAAPTVFEVIAAGRSHFRIDDLLRLVALIVRQMEAGRAVARRRKVSSK